MSENYEYCYSCGEMVRRIGLDDEPSEYVHCMEGYGCNKDSPNLNKEKQDG